MRTKLSSDKWSDGFADLGRIDVGKKDVSNWSAEKSDLDKETVSPVKVKGETEMKFRKGAL